MNENINGINSENRIYRPVDSLNIGGMNNRTHIYSSVNTIYINGINQIIYCDYNDSRVNTININGMNNTVYINNNSNLCTQNIHGANNRIIFTNRVPIQDNFNLQNPDRNLAHSAPLLRNNVNINDSNINLNNSNLNNDNQNNNEEENMNNRDYPSAPININNNNVNNENEFTYERRHDHDVIEDVKCNICNTNFNNNDIIKKMECGHIYHKYCLDKFIERQIYRNDNLPLCLICFQWEMQDNINRGNI